MADFTAWTRLRIGRVLAGVGWCRTLPGIKIAHLEWFPGKSSRTRDGWHEAYRPAWGAAFDCKRARR